MTSADDIEGRRKPSVLFVYYTYSQQTLRVVESMAEVLRGRGCKVQLAKIEFTDPRYAERFAQFPLRHAYLDIFGMVLPQFRGLTGEIQIPDEVHTGSYDLVCIASPTWWLHPCMPIRPFIESEVAGRLLAGKPCAAVAVAHRYWRDDLRILKNHIVLRGGIYVGGSHFTAGGGPLDSMLALFSYLSTGVTKDRYLIKIPPATLQPSYLCAAVSRVRKPAGRTAWWARRSRDCSKSRSLRRCSIYRMTAAFALGGHLTTRTGHQPSERDQCPGAREQHASRSPLHDHQKQKSSL